MYVLYNRHSCVTGRELRAALDCRGGMTSHYGRRNPEVVVRWGNSAGEEGGRVLNSAESVAKAANKLLSLQLMKEAGVNVPRFDVTPTAFGDGAVVFGRRRYHSGGRDIEVLSNEYTTPVVYSDYFTEFVPSVREMRIHIFEGELLGAQVKQWRGVPERRELHGGSGSVDESGDTDTPEPGPEPEVPIRNLDRGYVFVPYLHSTPNQSRIDVARHAVDAHGLDFGAVDILCLPGGGECVLEVNTAPGLSPRFLELYTTAIGSWAERSEGQREFDVRDVSEVG